MAQSLAKIYVHLIFSTKNRDRVIPGDIGFELHKYMGGILRDLNCSSIEINTEPDHAHVLFLLARTIALNDAVGQLKKGSTVWLQQQGPMLTNFHWQNGFGAFSVSQSNVAQVRAYIRRQAEHHARLTFQDEFRAFMNRHEMEFDERYVWD